MKKRTRTTLTVAGVLVAVGFAGFLAFSAHGRFEGLINATDDRPVVTPPAGLAPNSGTGGTTSTAAQPALTPPTGQGKVDIGLNRHRGERGEGGGFGEGGE